MWSILENFPKVSEKKILIFNYVHICSCVCVHVCKCMHTCTCTVDLLGFLSFYTSICINIYKSFSFCCRYCYGLLLLFGFNGTFINIQHYLLQTLYLSLFVSNVCFWHPCQTLSCCSYTH